MSVIQGSLQIAIKENYLLGIRQAILVIDEQTEDTKIQYMMDNQKRLLDQARTLGIRVFFIEIDVEGHKTFPYLKRSCDKVIYKSTPNAFFGTTLDAELRAEGITNIIVMGQSINLCVKVTILGFPPIIDGAIRLGYRVLTSIEIAHDDREKRDTSYFLPRIQADWQNEDNVFFYTML